MALPVEEFGEEDFSAEEEAGDVTTLVDPLGDARKNTAVLDAEELEKRAPPRPAETGDNPDAIVQAAKAMRQNGASSQAKSLRCLVVDDSRVIRKITGTVAKNMGYAVAEAENGEEALAICKQTMPDLVITDWDMPEMDGLSFVTALRAIPASTAPKVVFCTSKGEHSDIHKGIAAGADDYIVKPFKEEGLRAKLEQLG